MLPDILQQIIEAKRQEVESTRQRAAAESWVARVKDLPSPPRFYAALAAGGRMRVIAEIKRASPSAGVLRDPFDVAAIARSYARNGADALSVLTDRPFFQGCLEDLQTARSAVSLPLLRKDFIIDPSQILEARLAGASAVLLIAECLSGVQLSDLAGFAADLNLDCLVELHDPENMPIVVQSGARIIGINNRNLRTFSTDLNHTLGLLTAIPKDRVIVSESGIRTAEDVDRLHMAGVHAVLIGESFMRAPDPGKKLAEILRLG